MENNACESLFWLAILSNIAGVVPVYFAVKRRNIPLGMFITTSIISSMWYHAFRQNDVEIAVLRFIDNAVVYSTCVAVISHVTLSLFLRTDDTGNTIAYTTFVSMAVANIGPVCLTLYALSEIPLLVFYVPAAFLPFVVWYHSLFSRAIVLGMVHRLLRHKIRLCLIFVTGVLALTCFVLVRNDCGTVILHSLWHVLVFLSMGLML